MLRHVDQFWILRIRFLAGEIFKGAFEEETVAELSASDENLSYLLPAGESNPRPPDLWASLQLKGPML